MTTALYIDLDKTLIRSELYWECLVSLLKARPFYIFLVPFWRLKGKGYVISKIASLIDLDIAYLPYNQNLLTWLKKKQQHKKVILLSPANQDLANKIAAHCACFSEVCQQINEQQYERIGPGSDYEFMPKKAGLKTWLSFKKSIA